MAKKSAAGFMFAGTMLLASLWTASGFLHGSPTPAWGFLQASNPCISRHGISKMGVMRIPSTKRENGPVMKLTIPASNIKIDWGKPVAAGGFGAVYFAQTIDQEDVVVKVAFSDDFSERLLENEGHFNDKLASSVPQCNGRNWARFMGEFSIGNKFQGFPKEVSSRRALVFRREQGNTLDNFLAGPASDLEKAISLYTSGSSTVLRVELFKKVLGELLCSIAHLHSRGILHRDIKPENVLVTPGDKISPLKLIDLGSGCDIATKDRRGLYDETIDPIYAPPEQVVDLAYPGNYDSYCAAVTAIRVLFPSLGTDVDVCLKWREELAACNSDLVAWCESKADSDEQTAIAVEARELLKPDYAPQLKLLAGMMHESVSERTPVHVALASLGPVWAARLQSVELMSSVMAGHAVSARATWTKALSRVVPETSLRVSGVTKRMQRVWATVLPRALAFTLKGALGVIRLALGQGWAWRGLGTSV